MSLIQELGLYHYKAVVSGPQYDGDTWTLDIDLGFKVWLRDQSVRLLGINTPEVRGEERIKGQLVRDFVRSEWPVGTYLLIESAKDKAGKYGRWLGTLWVPGEETSINQQLIDLGCAEPAVY